MSQIPTMTCKNSVPLRWSYWFSLPKIVGHTWIRREFHSQPSTKPSRIPCTILFVPIMMFLFLKSPYFNSTRNQSRQLATMHRRLKENKAVEVVTFLGVPVIYSNSSSSLVSSVHCVGENYAQNTSWMYRSCQFQNLCYHTVSKEFIFFMSPQEVALQEILNVMKTTQEEDIFSISTIARDHRSGVKMISLGTLHDTTSVDPWNPTIVKEESIRHRYLSSGFYLLSENTVMLPVMFSTEHSAIWQDYFSIYALLSIFGLEDQRLIMMNRKQEVETADVLLSAFGVQSANVGHIYGDSPPMIINQKGDEVQPNLICARHAVAGLGMLTAHSVSRGATLYAFREYIQRNMKLTDAVSSSSLIVSIAFEGTSKDNWHELLRSCFEQRKTVADFAIQKVDMNLHLQNVLKVAANSMVFIAPSGSDVLLVASTCLPRGSTLIILDFHDSTLGESDIRSRELEKEYMETPSYFNLHWISVSSQDKAGQAIYESVADIVMKKIIAQRAQ